MVNKKRDKSTYIKKLDRYHLKRADLLAIEKILWIYTDTMEMKKAGVSKMPEGRKHMPRKYIDRHVSLGRYRPYHIKFGRNYYEINYAGVDWIYREDSVKFLSKKGYPRKARYLKLSAWPGIYVTFTPLSTTIYAQTHNASGEELRSLKEVSDKIEDYLLRLPIYNLNYCELKTS